MSVNRTTAKKIRAVRFQPEGAGEVNIAKYLGQHDQYRDHAPGARG
jgi:hypothetical protein